MQANDDQKSLMVTEKLEVCKDVSAQHLEVTVGPNVNAPIVAGGAHSHWIQETHNNNHSLQHFLQQ